MVRLAEYGIRKMASGDIGSCYRIGKEHFGNQRWLTRSFVLQTFRASGAHFVAVAGKRVVGCIMLSTSESPNNWIYYFVVAKGWRGIGVGSALLQAIQKNRRGTRIFVDTGARDSLAQKFFRSHGFAEEGRVRHWFEGEKAVLYSKKLK